jgi:hypothetical protein
MPNDFFVAVHVREIEYMHDMHMSVNRLRQRELPAAVDAYRVNGRE